MKSLEELRAIREKMQQQMDLREKSADDIRVVVGMATCRCSPPFWRRWQSGASSTSR